MLEVAIARPQGKVAHLPQREQYETYIANLLPKLNSLAICFARPDFDLAKDLVQESVIKGYQAFMNGGLTLDDRTKAWFATVIRNEFLMHRRKNKRLAGELDDQYAGADGRRDFENAALRDVLQRAIEELPDCAIIADVIRQMAAG